MPKSDMRLAILGAGPIGLEAALYARAATFRSRFTNEAASRNTSPAGAMCDFVSPFGMNVTPLGRAAALKQKPSLEMPGNDIVYHRPRACANLFGAHR